MEKDKKFSGIGSDRLISDKDIDNLLSIVNESKTIHNPGIIKGVLHNLKGKKVDAIIELFYALFDLLSAIELIAFLPLIQDILNTKTKEEIEKGGIEQGLKFLLAATLAQEEVEKNRKGI